jgi:hypothetical protein
MPTFRPRGLINDSLLSQYQSALEIAQDLPDVADLSEEVIIDLRGADWFTPTFLVPISVLYNQARDAGVEFQIRFPFDYQVRSYLEQIGFPEGAPRPPERYKNHLPLCSVNTELEEDTFEIVSKKLRNLIKQFLGERNLEGINWLTYPIGEIIDNSDQHSNCDFGSLLIQYYPTKEALDVCIVDDGISIPANFERYGIDFDSDEEAVRMAMVEGRSTRPDAGHERGYGLRTTVEMICDGLNGKVLLSSRGATLFRSSNNGVDARLGDYQWDGTVFAARLYPPTEEFDYLPYVTP